MYVTKSRCGSLVVSQMIYWRFSSSNSYENDFWAKEGIEAQNFSWLSLFVSSALDKFHTFYLQFLNLAKKKPIFASKGWPLDHKNVIHRQYNRVLIENWYKYYLLTVSSKMANKMKHRLKENYDGHGFVKFYVLINGEIFSKRGRS